MAPARVSCSRNSQMVLASGTRSAHVRLAVRSGGAIHFGPSQSISADYDIYQEIRSKIRRPAPAGPGPRCMPRHSASFRSCSDLVGGNEVGEALVTLWHMM